MTREPWLRHVLLLPFAPWTLARAAYAAPGPLCAGLGLFCLAVFQAMIPVARLHASGSNVPSSIGAHLLDAWMGVPFFTLIALIPSTFFFLPLVWGISRTEQYRYATPRTRARFAAAWLSPLAMLLIVGLWYTTLLLRIAPSPIRPAWCGSPIFLAIGSNIALLFVAALAIANFAIASRRLRPLTTTPDLCPSCRYSLRGLPPNAPCPECGTQTSNLKADISNTRTPV